MVKSQKNVESYTVCTDNEFYSLWHFLQWTNQNAKIFSAIPQHVNWGKVVFGVYQVDQSSGTICKHLIAFREFYLANIPQALKENVGDSDEDKGVYESIVDNNYLPDNKVEVNKYTFLGTLC